MYSNSHRKFDEAKHYVSTKRGTPGALGKGLGKGQRDPASRWYVLVTEHIARWHLVAVDGLHYELPLVTPPQHLKVATGGSLLAASKAPAQRVAREKVKKIQHCSDVAFEVREQDNASSNKRYLVHILPPNEPSCVWW